MSLKLKALGLGLLAAMAFSAVAVMNASANGSGHFVSEAAHTNIVGSEGGTHNLHLTNHGLSGEVGCAQDTYTATAEGATVNDLLVTATYGGCTTTGTSTTVPVDMNGCKYRFTVAGGTTSSTEQTVHLECPAGQSIKVTHPNCTVTVHPQTVNTGVTYTHVTENGKNAVTLDSNVQFNTTRHGLCQFIAPTNGTGTLVGSATVQGFNTEGTQVSVTAT
ncbi:MAG TPA: hypothetical protein VF729_02805 [Solirubrobacterales bacterium]